jgi:hypothetical protein
MSRKTLYLKEKKGMAVKYIKNTIEKVDIKGIMNEEATTITFERKDAPDETIMIQDYLNQFASMPVQITIQTKMEEELDLPEETAYIGDNGELIYE